MKDLNKLSKEIYEANKAKGFHEEKHSEEHMMCLVISELMEAVEADRNGRRADMDNFNRQYDYDWSENYNDYIKGSIDEELADAAIRLLDTARALGMQLEDIGKDNNFDYYATKDGFKKHSFTENIFYIIDRYFRSSEIIDDRMSRMIFHIDILCEVMDIDLSEHVALKLKYNSLRPYKHGKQY